MHLSYLFSPCHLDVEYCISAFVLDARRTNSKIKFVYLSTNMSASMHAGVNHRAPVGDIISFEPQRGVKCGHGLKLKSMAAGMPACWTGATLD